MIVDTSALLAILLGESGAQRYDEAIAQEPLCRMSVASLLEATMVLEGRRGVEIGSAIDAYLAEAAIELVPVSVEQASVAREAWRRFGKGNLPAALNFGDCFVYALAETTGEPLLCKGGDFALTDIETVEL